MIKIYFIEYNKTIKFFGGNENTFEIIKNKQTYYLLQKALKNKKFIFKNLLTK